MLKVLVVFLLAVISQAQLDFGCGSFSYGTAAEATWDKVDCGTQQNWCSATVAKSPLPITGPTENSELPLSRLRFSGFEDGIFDYETEDIFRYDYTSPQATFRTFDDSLGAFTPIGISAHHPAEHKIPAWSNDHPDLELQFHFKNMVTGKLASVAFFFWSWQDDNKFLNFLTVPTTNGRTLSEIKGVQDFFNGIQGEYMDSYYYYEGELTFPPCSPTHWHIMTPVMKVGHRQLAVLQRELSRPWSQGGNARTLRPTGTTAAFFNVTGEAMQDPVCGGDMYRWDSDGCKNQLTGSDCFYCRGKAHGVDFYNCLNREGRECLELQNSPETISFCNVEFACPASTLSLATLLAFVCIAIANFF